MGRVVGPEEPWGEVIIEDKIEPFSGFSQKVRIGVACVPIARCCLEHCT